MSKESFCLKSAGLVYLDHNATTPLATSVYTQISDWSREWGNSSSIHQLGRGPKALIRNARTNLASFIGASPLEIVFTSSGSEANNLAIKGVYENLLKNKSLSSRNQFILSSVEHPSVQKAMEFLKSKGAQVDIVNVLPTGELDIEHFESLLSDNTALVSIMFANNETGVVFPVKKLCKKTHEVGALFHCDAVQGLGKLPLNVKHLGVDYASFSGHKFYALKGCGVLYIKTGCEVQSLISGGGQERSRRAGTENTLAIAALGHMALKYNCVLEQAERLTVLRDHLQTEISKEIGSIEIISFRTKRIPNTISMMILGVNAQSVIMNLDMQGFLVSTGSACSSGSSEPSPVLLAMGFTTEQALSTIRVSIGWGTTKEELEMFVMTLKNVVTRLRALNTESK